MSGNEAFIDETRTGETSSDFRGLGRATIAARWPAGADLAWLPTVIAEVRERPGAGTEIKSSHILRVADSNRRVGAIVEHELGRAEIVIVDFFLAIQQAMEQLCQVFHVDPRVGGTPQEIVGTGAIPRAVVDQVIYVASREAVETSALGPLEFLLRDALQSAHLSTARPHHVDRDQLAAMSGTERQEAIARVSTALGTAFHPDELLSAAEVEVGRWAPQGFVSISTLYKATAIDQTFDAGAVAAFGVTMGAHRRITNSLSRAAEHYLGVTGSPGQLREEDSAHLLGLTAADLAAAVARRIYERFPHDRLEGARAIAQRFDRVLLNDEWVG